MTIKLIGFATAALAALALGWGCKDTVTEADNKAMLRENTEEHYKENMYKAGRGAEYEAEKARQQKEYKQGEHGGQG